MRDNYHSMSLKEILIKEKNVVLYGQPKKFRIKKYIVLAILATALYLWKGWHVVGMVFLTLAVLGTIVHFIFRWKTDGWEKSWGPYKK
jgi:hypothetical protein